MSESGLSPRSQPGHKRSVEVAIQFRYPRSHPLTLNDRSSASRSQVALPRRGHEKPLDSTARIADNRPIRMFPAGSNDEESGVGASHCSHRLLGYMLHISDRYDPFWMDRNAVRIDGRLDRDDIELSNGRGSPYAWWHHIQSRVANQISADLCFARVTPWRFFACQHPRQLGSIWREVTAKICRSKSISEFPTVATIHHEVPPLRLQSLINVIWFKI